MLHCTKYKKETEHTCIDCSCIAHTDVGSDAINKVKREETPKAKVCSQ